jgi:hypothetical protein
MTMLIGINDQTIEASPEMAAKIKADQDAYAANEKRLADERTAKESAKAALLERLGITADEAALLFS